MWLSHWGFYAIESHWIVTIDENNQYARRKRINDMSHDFEERVDRLAFDLRTGYTNDAANIIRDELRCNPQETLALIRTAEQINRGRGHDHLYVRPDGDIMISDPECRRDVFVGQLQPCLEDRRDNYYSGQRIPRYGDRDGCYGNGGYDRDRGYDRNRGYNRGYDPDCDRDYGQRPPVIFEPPVVYQPPIIYAPRNRYPDDQYGYPNDGYGYGHRNNTVRDIAIGAIGGIILDRAINRR